MSKIRKTRSPSFKLKVAMAAIKGEHTYAELSKIYSVHSSQIQKWKVHLEKEAPVLFSEKRGKSNAAENQATVSRLHEKIGQLTVERDFLEQVLSR